jgi:hypothetical protein
MEQMLNNCLGHNVHYGFTKHTKDIWCFVVAVVVVMIPNLFISRLDNGNRRYGKTGLCIISSLARAQTDHPPSLLYFLQCESPPFSHWIRY